jgi:hypothetical protein
MQEIKKIKVLSLANIIALFGILMGLIYGISMGYLSMQYTQAGLSLTMGEALEYIVMNPLTGIMPIFIALGWWSVIVSPIIFGIGYFIAGAILGLLFNLFAKLLGGIKVEIIESKVIKRKK